MQIRIPTGQQMYALQRVFAVPGETWPNHIPRGIIRECMDLGWIEGSEADGYHMTDDGHAAWRRGH